MPRGSAVTKSLLSLIESGKRLPTETQISILAEVLGIPPDLLVLGSSRLPHDVRSAFEAKAAEAIAAVRHHTESQAVAYSTAPRTVPLPKAARSPRHGRQLPERLDVRKTSLVYRTHSYHTKMPPEAIRPFISAFTRPGELVFDPFCGSGMTGVAAVMEGRHALLSDVSPAAVHIARNYTTPCDPEAFADALATVEETMKPTIAWLYRPVGTDQIVEYTTWSDVHRCASCHSPILYWDVVQSARRTRGTRLTCPHCGKGHRKADPAMDRRGAGPEPHFARNTSNRHPHADP